MHDGKVVIVTSKDDAHADHLISVAMASGFDDQTIRINTEDFSLNTKVTFTGREFIIAFDDSKRELNSEEVKSVWFRRPKDLIQSNSLDKASRVYSEKQWTAFIRGLYFSTHDKATWVNPLPSIHRARIKLQQLKLAHELEFDVPNTCVTNDPRRAREFFTQNTLVCTKSLDEPNFNKDGHIFPMYTRVVKDISEFDDEASIEISPVLLQEFIEKSHDVRVVVIGDRLFSVAIDSQKKDESATDFRAVNPRLLEHREIRLEAALEQKILSFVRHQGLIYSAMDFCLDKRSGKFFFLENNCNGQWLWLERMCGVTITAEMIKLLYG
jgi:glutathione synthase/RimK-type ligase-like ATP-grasp enzyme